MVTYPIESITIRGGFSVRSDRVARILILWKTRGQNERERQRGTRAHTVTADCMQNSIKSIEIWVLSTLGARLEVVAFAPCARVRE